MKNQIKYFYIGLCFLILAMIDITIAPFALRKILDGIYISNKIFINVEITLLAFVGFFYFLTPRYYRKIMYSIILALLYYILFVQIYSMFS